MMKRLALIVAAAGMALSAARGGIGDWKNFTAMNAVRGVASSHDSLWAATSGGAFLYHIADSSFTRITNSEGLTTNDITAITIDRTGAVWFGQADGSIDVYSPASGRWRYVRDIAVSSKTQKRINAFFLSGDSLYIATAFGVSLFSIPRFEFIDTYGNFGTVAVPPVTAVAVHNNRVYAATTQAVVVSRPGAVNLAAPESWTVFDAMDGVSSLALFKGTVAAAGAHGFFTFDGSAWSADPSVPSPVTIAARDESRLYLAQTISDTQHTIFSLTAGGVPLRLGAAIADVVTGGTVVNGALAFATDSSGIAFGTASDTAWATVMPNGPASNSFVGLAVDASGAIWCASGYQNGHGFYSYDGSMWHNYSMKNVPGLRYNECFGVAIGPDDSKWLSMWGGGLVLLNSKGEFVRIFDKTYPGFFGLSNDTNYIVPAVPSFDASGNVWTSIYLSGDNAKVVWKMKPDFTWESYPAALGSYKSMLGVHVDRNDTKWFTNAIPSFPAEARFVFLHEGKPSIAGTTEDGWGLLTEANGITNASVTSIVEDREGALWFGTSVGITVINDPLRPGTATKVFLGAVRDQYINCITLDAVNNKWIGTARGVFVLSPDGTSLLEQYTVANSNGKLVDDNVLSIAFDAKNGLAYFGTAKGLSSVGIATVAPSPDYSTLSVAPNPFRTWIDHSVTINGLAEGSTIKILTLTGKLVRQFSAQGGGRAFWDGNTDSGEPAASGIYIAVAYSENGSSLGTAKLAVIRR